MPNRSGAKAITKERALMGLGLLGAAAATTGAFLLRRSASRPEIETDAPHWTLDKTGQGDRPVFGKSLLIKASRDELFARWRNVEAFPDFMENVERVERTSDDVSHWTIKAPAGRTVTLVNRMTDVDEGRSISWQSEPESDVANSGKVSFEDAPNDRGTYVSLVLSYDPPGGKLGRWAAKLLQREPEIQARRDLRRFKQLVETGEVTTNASPSGRTAENPTESHL